MDIYLDKRMNSTRRLQSVPIDIEARKAKDRRKPDKPDKDLERSFLPKEKIISLLETLKSEQKLLFEFLKIQEDKKSTAIKSSFGVFSIIITGLIAVYTLSEKLPDGVSLGYPFNLIFAAVLVGLCLTNLVIIKIIMSYRAGLLLGIRQLNCNRQAIDRITFTIFEEKFPLKESELKDESTIYWSVYGQHRKLPINNIDLRRQNQSIISSSDEFAVIVIAFFTMAIFIAPIAHIFIVAKQSTILGIVGTITLLGFGYSVYKIIKLSRTAVDNALKTEAEESK